MTDDALAAVAAAAHVLFARDAKTPDVPHSSRWNLSSRLRTADAATMRLGAAARSRWAMSGRLR